MQPYCLAFLDFCVSFISDPHILPVPRLIYSDKDQMKKWGFGVKKHKAGVKFKLIKKKKDLVNTKLSIDVS